MGLESPTTYAAPVASQVNSAGAKRQCSFTVCWIEEVGTFSYTSFLKPYLFSASLPTLTPRPSQRFKVWLTCLSTLLKHTKLRIPRRIRLRLIDLVPRAHKILESKQAPVVVFIKFGCCTLAGYGYCTINSFLLSVKKTENNFVSRSVSHCLIS